MTKKSDNIEKEIRIAGLHMEDYLERKGF